MKRALSVLQDIQQLLFSEGDASMEAELHVPSCAVPQDPKPRNNHALVGTVCSFAAASYLVKRQFLSISKEVLGTLTKITHTHKKTILL